MWKMLREKEYLVDENNKVWYIDDVISDGTVELIRIKYSRKINDFKFKDKFKKVNVNEDNLFKFRSFDVEEAWIVAMFLKNLQYDSCGNCCEDLE